MTSADASTTPLRRYPITLRALFVVVGVIAALAYAINAWQVYGFATHVWKLPTPLCFGAALVADALSLAAVFATYLLRNADRAVRAYAWLVFFAMTGLSIAAAESFAAWRKLPEDVQKAGQGTGWAAQFAAGAIVVALALAVHLLIVVRRHVDPAPDDDAGSPTELAPPARRNGRHPAGADAAREAVALDSSDPPAPVRRLPIRPDWPRARPDGRQPTSGRTANPPDPRRAKVIERCLDGDPPEDAKKVAAGLGVKARTAQLWVKNERERRATANGRTGYAGHLAGAGAHTVSDVQADQGASASAAFSDAPVPKG